MTESLTHADIGTFALDFLDNLKTNEEKTGEQAYFAAIIMVAGLDEDGEPDVAMRTSSSHSLANIRVLQAAQITQTLLALKHAREDADA